MTSSSRSLQSGQPFWNYDIRKFKQHPTHCEPGLISILFLASGKHKLTSTCLESTYRATKQYKGEIEWIFLENITDQDLSYDSDRNLEYFSSFAYNYLDRATTIIKNKNYGINVGWNDLWAVSRGEFVMLHENDFLNTAPHFDFLSRAIEIFEDPQIQMVQLRNPLDACENWGYGKPMYNPWSCSKEVNEKENISVLKCETKSGWTYLKSRFAGAYNNNPIIVRKAFRDQIGHMNEPMVGTDPRHDETHYQEKVYALKPWTAHINFPLYEHVGGTRRQSIEGI